MRAGTRTPTIVVAGTSSGVGKTTVAIGVMHTLHKAGLRVQPFKVGPDFLDGLQHTSACAGAPSINLDGWMMGRSGCLAAFDAAVNASAADVAVVEGCMGLHDGRDGTSDDGSTAQIAKWLGAPVLLVLDAWNLGRSAAAMVHGYRSFDPDVNLAAVLFNRVASPAHATWLQQAMASAPATETVRIMGCLPSDARLAVAERLLGLLPPPGRKTSKLASRLDALRALLDEHVGVDALRNLAAASMHRPAEPHRTLADAPPDAPRDLPPVRIAVARDAAFCFLYHDNVRVLREAGAEVVFFSPLADAALPEDVNLLYLVGGYPELHAAQLHGNSAMREAVRRFCSAGGLVWAECGGLMYLARRIVLRPVDARTAAEARREEEACDAAARAGGAQGNGEAVSEEGLVHEMVGVLPFDVTMTPRMTMGYCTVQLTRASAQLLRLPIGTRVRCQQYHFSEATVGGEPAVLVDPATGGGAGIVGVDEHAFEACMQAPNALPAPEGAVMHGRTVATYCHVHLGSDVRLAAAFVGAARRGVRVVSLLPSGTEMVAQLLGNGARARLIGVSEHCDWPAQLVKGLPVVSRSAVDLRGLSGQEVDCALRRAKEAGLEASHVLDVEWLAAARPGLVLTQDACPACDAMQGSVHAALQAAGVRKECALTLAPQTVGEMLECLQRVGEALGEPTECLAVVVDALAERIALVESAVTSVPHTHRPRVLGLESVCPLVASGQWLPDMRARAGGVDALGDVAGSAARLVTLEEVAGCEAQVLVLCCCGRSAEGAVREVEEHLLAHEALWRLPALRARPAQLYVLSHEHFSRPGPRLVDGIETLAALLHPKLLEAELVTRATAGVLQLVVEEGPAAGVKPGSWRFEYVTPRESSQPSPVGSSTESSLTDPPAAPPAVLRAGPPAAAPAAAPAVRLAPRGLQPPIRSASVLVNTGGGELLLFGGEAADARALADVWTLSSPSGGWCASSCPEPQWEGPWQCGATANENVPTERSNHAAVAAGDHLLVFGGWSKSQPLAQPELLHLQTRCWTHCSTVNEAPPPRGNPTLAYSSRRHLAVAYAGWDGRKRLADVWCLDMESWTWHRAACDKLGDEQPLPRTDHAAVLWQESAQSERMLVFGGSTRAGASDELWSLDCSGGAPAQWEWSDESGGGAAVRGGPWPPGRTSHAAAVAGCGASASLIVVGGQDGRRGSAATAIVADAWVLSPLGSASREWARLDWSGTYPLQRCRHSLCVTGELAIVYGGYDGVRTLDAHHSLFCATLLLEDSSRHTAARDDAGSHAEKRIRPQERWEAERPLTETDLPPEERERAARSTLPLAMAKALHRHAIKSEPPRDTYIDPATGYSVFTQAYLKRRPCCGNGCRHCPWGHANVPGRTRNGPVRAERDFEW